MNDTILTLRQKAIYNLINQSEGLSRDEIQQKLSGIYNISKPTLIRDLNMLLDSYLAKIDGRARASRYFPVITNPLFRQFDVDRYFQEDPDKRIVAHDQFDFKIFSKLANLLTKDEIEIIDKEGKSFEKTTQKLVPDILKRELERFVIELSWKSSKIEGNTYSLLETESLIKEKIEAEGKTKEEAIMVLNHKYAFDNILKNKKDFRKLNITTISQLHSLLVKDLNVSYGIRKQPVGITGTVYKPIDNEFQIKEAVEKLVTCVNETPNPFEKALTVHFMVPYIQPFTDGNKRTARMLTNAILLAHDLFPLSYRSVNEDGFKKALILFYEQSSIFYVKKLFIEQIIFANKNYFKF